MLQAGVRELKFINDTGVYNTDPAYPDGLYIGLKYKSKQGKEWKMDIWFVDEPERQPDLKHIITMPERLTEERREAILRITGQAVLNMAKPCEALIFIQRFWKKT
ncbi:hypothetical protein [Paenibacillus lautus]|jgi:hypothetical protein|uniref:hypothetical protein n=1 Tax=Paenibacillus lautus TaxID=1401 RepID=UPI001FEC1D3E|nr:hypothetical protein [Paenibacillus lautus]